MINRGVAVSVWEKKKDNRRIATGSWTRAERKRGRRSLNFQRDQPLDPVADNNWVLRGLASRRSEEAKRERKETKALPPRSLTPETASRGSARKGRVLLAGRVRIGNMAVARSKLTVVPPREKGRATPGRGAVDDDDHDNDA